jgi:hypothetical protein
LTESHSIHRIERQARLVYEKVKIVFRRGRRAEPPVIAWTSCSFWTRGYPRTPPPTGGSLSTLTRRGTRELGLQRVNIAPGVPVAHVDEREAVFPTMTALAWFRPLQLNLLGGATALKCLRRAYRATRVGLAGELGHQRSLSPANELSLRLRRRPDSDTL